MKKYFLLAILPLFLCACVSARVERLGSSLEDVMEADFKAVRLASLFHAQEGAWPRDKKALGDFKPEGESSLPEEQDRAAWTERISGLGVDGPSLIVHLESGSSGAAVPYHRIIRITPKTEGQYLAEYIVQPGDKVQMQGQMEVNVNEKEENSSK